MASIIMICAHSLSVGMGCGAGGVGADVTVATCTALPLLRPFVVTTAVKMPVEVGGVFKVTVS